MEVQLNELIEQIKKDGVIAAEEDAKAIVDAAKAEADSIVAQAKAQADKMVADAKAETERMTKSSEDAIRQAGRNLLISFRESVTRELTAVTAKQVAAAYASEETASMILRVIENWASKPDAEDLAVILNTADLNRLEDALLAALNEKIQQGVTLKANDQFDGGFRIAVNNGSAYYDYSAEAVVDMLSHYLSPRVTELLKEA